MYVHYEYLVSVLSEEDITATRTGVTMWVLGPEPVSSQEHQLFSTTRHLPYFIF